MSGVPCIESAEIAQRQGTRLIPMHLWHLTPVNNPEKRFSTGYSSLSE